MPPPMAAADSALVLEFVAGDRRISNAVFAALLASLPPPSTSRSPRLRKALALRALHAALHADSASSSALLLRRAREVITDPDIADCFPQMLPFALSDDKDEDSAAATIADLSRLLDHGWASLPPSALELAADRIAGSGALETWASADDAKRRKLRLLVGNSMEGEILAKLGQDKSASRPSKVLEVDKAANAPPETNGAKEIDHAPGDGKAVPFEKNKGADCAQEDQARQESVKGAPGAQLLEKSVASGTTKSKVHGTPQKMDKVTAPHVTGRSSPDNTKNHPVAGSKRSLMERDPSASIFEWDGLGSSDDERPLGNRQLPPFERKPKPSTIVSHKNRRKWSEIEEKTLLEGIEKYGKGSWKDIKIAYPHVFEDRSTVDLKDKFRNMGRH